MENIVSTIITPHRAGCRAMKDVRTRKRPEPWSYRAKLKLHDGRGVMEGDHFWFEFVCCDPDCPAVLRFRAAEVLYAADPAATGTRVEE